MDERSVRRNLLTLLRALPDDLAAFDAEIDRLAAHSASETARVWPALFAAAMEDGVAGALDVGLARRSDLPSVVHDAVLRRSAVSEAWHAHQLEQLRQAVGILDDAGIEACALKGPALAARLYAPAAARHSVDLDLLVRHADLDRAIEAFARAGYATDSGATAAYLRKHSHHVHLVRRDATPLELHFCAYAGFGVALPAQWIFERPRRFSFGNGSDVGVPAPEEEVVYLAVHAAGHTYFRLMWLYDLKLLIRENRSLDWERVSRQAAAFGVAGAVGYTLRLLNDWMDVEVPRSMLRRGGMRSRLADRLLEEVSTPQPPSAGNNLAGLLFTSLLCDRVASGVGLVGHHVGRSARRRLKRAAPFFLPDRWSG